MTRGLSSDTGVGGHRVAEARVKLFCDRCAADDVSSLEHAHAQSCRRQIRGTREPVMAPADDECVDHVREIRLAGLAGYNQQCVTVPISITQRSKSRTSPDFIRIPCNSPLQSFSTTTL